MNRDTCTIIPAHQDPSADFASKIAEDHFGGFQVACQQGEAETCSHFRHPSAEEAVPFASRSMGDCQVFEKREDEE